MDLLTGGGRVGRLRYLTTSLVLSAFALLVWFGAGERDPATDEITLTAEGFGILVVIAWLQLMNSVRRLHDRSHGGLMVVLLAVPVIGVAVALYLLVTPGTPVSNRFGPAGARGGNPVTGHDRLAHADAVNHAAHNESLLDQNGSFDMDGLWRDSDINRS